MSTVTPPPPPTHKPPPEGQQAPPKYGESQHNNGEKPPPGGHAPEDFGTGKRNPDHDGDGVISDAEASVYSADTRSDSSKYKTDSKERMAADKEEGKNYRAEVEARTAQNASNNDNKIHKMTGKQTTPPVPMPTRPEGPAPT